MTMLTEDLPFELYSAGSADLSQKKLIDMRIIYNRLSQHYFSSTIWKKQESERQKNPEFINPRCVDSRDLCLEDSNAFNMTMAE